MVKLYDLETLTFAHTPIQFFSIREKNDRNGNPRFRVYILFEGVVHETIFKCYNGQISERVKMFIVDMLSERGCN